MDNRRDSIKDIFHRYKVFLSIVLLIIAISAIMLIIKIYNEDKEIPVKFTNDKFREAVELSLDDDYLTTKDIENISVLKLENVNLDSELDDLSLFINLKELYINNCNISSIEDMKFPSQLQVLDVSYNNINKLSIPRQIDNSDTIKKVIANGNPIIDIDTDGLSESSINELSLQNCDLVGNIDFGDNNQIEKLVLDDNAIMSIDGVMPNLSYLSVNNNNFDSITSLTKYENLTELYITGNYLNNIDGIKRLSNLETIDIRENMITNVYELENLNKLSSVYVDYEIDRKQLEFMCDHWRNGDVETKKYFLKKRYNLDVR